jgi:esterase/lipase superfamily enzyme
LREIATSRRSSAPRFNQIVLTAPDIDLGTFTQLSAAFVGGLAQRITLYASSNDVALQLSKRYQGYQRAGDTVPNVLVLSGVDTIDVSAVDTSLLGHSYYGDNKSVLSDIFAVIREAKPPNQRFGIRPAGRASRQWWIFKP